MENKKLNELKEQIKSEENKCLILGIVVSVVLFLITKSYISIFGGIIFSIILSSVSLSSLRHEYQSEFKRIFVENTLKEYFTDLVYDSNKGLDENILSSTGMIYTGDKYQSNDFASGKYKDVNFMQADVKIDELHVTRDDKGHTKAYYVTLFLGKWMIFDFNKEFKANFQVVEKNFSVSKIGDSVFKNSKFEKVEMEGKKYILAVPNFSEGRRQDVIDAISNEIRNRNDSECWQVALKAYKFWEKCQYISDGK